MLGALRDEVVPDADRTAQAEPDQPPAEQGGTSTAEQPTEPVAEPEVEQPAVEPPVVTAEAPPVTPEPDPVCAAAVDLALAAALEDAGPVVGEHLGVHADDVDVVTHLFASTDPAYRGWHWAVTVARADGSDVVTVDEVVLLPGAGALLAPAWVPYSDRVQPEDLSPGDLLPPPADDVRLVPAYADPDALVEEVVWELGLGRPRVLSREGRLDAAQRWYEGEAGPDSPRAKAAPGRCGDCGFLVPLGGALSAAFGACANGQAPDDGRVVALDHGCGAHSETPVELTHALAAGMAVRAEEFDVERHGARPAGTLADPHPGPADEEQAEQLGHS